MFNSFVFSITYTGIFFVLSVAFFSAFAQPQVNPWNDKFRQLGPDEMATPNTYRTASGAPGTDYWQQQKFDEDLIS
jgi:hypothetical protein